MTAADAVPFALYGAAWVAFGALHSILAGAGVKSRLDRLFGAGYRLAYNIFAVVTLALVFWIGHLTLGDLPRFELSGTAKIGLSALAVGGWGLMFWALTGYDLGRFAGTAQLRAARSGAHLAEDEPLRTGGLHRYVRHPIYSAAFMVLWGAAWTPLGLATAALASLYLLIGSSFEERRLRRLYGRAYADYRDKVPAFIPWRGRAL